MLKKTVLMSALTLALLFATAQVVLAGPKVSRAWEALASQYFATAIVYDDRVVAAAVVADVNAENAELFARYAQYYANYAAATGDRNAALAAYNYGYWSAIYSSNSLNMTGNQDSFTAFQFAWYGAYYALVGAGGR